MKPRVYFDAAATSRQKPPSVLAAVHECLAEIGCSPGRGGYECALDAGRLVLETRLAVAGLFNVPAPEQVVFTHNITYALNMAIKGLLRPGDHVVTTAMEHNAVVRPLCGLAQRAQVSTTFVPCDRQGRLDPADVAAAIRPNTRLLVATHASNVTGTIMPLAELGRVARESGAFFAADTAQTAGVCDLDFQALGLDVLAFTGHKGLLGLPGTGGFAVSRRAAEAMVPLIEGGTGSLSDRELQPDFLPDRFESGTMNTPGLAGLRAGIAFLQQEGLARVRRHEQELTARLLEGLTQLPGVTVHGPGDTRQQTATVSITVDGWDLGELAFVLDDRFGIMTRSGLHCAPLAHQTIGTYPAGTLRLSLGYFNTVGEVEYVVESLGRLCLSPGCQ
ncbi:MAG: aminotransferase class V-fold PLP-dependent enzyme [Bacillota bacterium]